MTIKNFEQLFQLAVEGKPPTIGIVCAHDLTVLQAISHADSLNIARGLLVGDEGKIRQIADKNNIDLTNLEIINEKNEVKACQKAISLIREDKADLLMKGKIDTATMLKEVLNRETGLRRGQLLSHVAVTAVPSWDKLVLLSDGGLIIRPTPEQLVSISENALEVAYALGIKAPVTYYLSYENLQLAPDYLRQVDVWIVPSLETGNVLGKSFIYFAHYETGGVIVGARVPIILLSRVDDTKTKLNSIVLGVHLKRNIGTYYEPASEFRPYELMEAQQMFEEAILDSRVELFKIPYLKHRLKEEIKRSLRYQLKFSFIVFEAEISSQIKDEALLNEITKVINDTLRTGIDIASYDKEKISILLPETDLRGAVNFSYRLKKSLSENVSASLRFNFGVSGFPSDGCTLDRIINSAELSLEKARQLEEGIYFSPEKESSCVE